ncbi:MAG: hypothetical protein AAF658_16650, partial [Myxococcota bacterium]
IVERDDDSRVIAFSTRRWGAPDGSHDYEMHSYGGHIDSVDERGHPSTLRVGWNIDAADFDDRGCELRLRVEDIDLS